MTGFGLIDGVGAHSCAPLLAKFAEGTTVSGGNGRPVARPGGEGGVRRTAGPVIFFVLLFFSVGGAEAAMDFSGKKTQGMTPIAESSQEIRVGEKLSYDVSWMGVPVGIGELEVVEKTSNNGRDAYHMVAVAGTNEFLSKIYPVRDEIHSWVDAETLQSLQFEKKVSEGKYRAAERVRYDAAEKKGYYESLKNGDKKEFDISVPVHDVVSAFFWVRRQTLIPGKTVKTTVNNGEKDYALEVDVLRRETKELRGQGVVDAILIEPKTRLQGVLDKRGRVWIYLENTPARVPLIITLKTPFGPIVGVLKRKAGKSGTRT